MILNAVSWIRRISEKVSNKFKQMFDIGASEKEEIQNSENNPETIISETNQNNELVSEVEIFENNEVEIINVEINKAEINEVEINEVEINEVEINEVEINEVEINEVEINETEIFEAEISQAEISQAEINEAEINEAEINKAEINAAEIKLAKILEAEVTTAEIIEKAIQESNERGITVSELKQNQTTSIKTKPDSMTAENTKPETIETESKDQNNEDNSNLSEKELMRILEAALFSAGQTLDMNRMMSLFPEDSHPGKDTIGNAINALQQQYAEHTSLELKEVSSGFRFQVRDEYSSWVAKLFEERPAKYSRATLETMALITYRQPITRAEIEEVRGVSVSSQIIKTLMEREWIRVVGHRDVPGKPALYSTTKGFLDYFNLKSLDELPALSELRDIDEINAELDFQTPAVAAESNDEESASIDNVDSEAKEFGTSEDKDESDETQEVIH